MFVDPHFRHVCLYRAENAGPFGCYLDANRQVMPVIYLYMTYYVIASWERRVWYLQ